MRLRTRLEGMVLMASQCPVGCEGHRAWRDIPEWWDPLQVYLRVARCVSSTGVPRTSISRLESCWWQAHSETECSLVARCSVPSRGPLGKLAHLPRP